MAFVFGKDESCQNLHTLWRLEPTAEAAALAAAAASARHKTTLLRKHMNYSSGSSCTTTIDETSTDDKISETSGKLQSEETEGEMLELDGLDTFTNYSIRVAAYTRAGRGKTSLQIFCKTAEDGNFLIE